jgi:CRISP-associated protein Cas1
MPSLKSHVRTEIAAQGYDPTIGYLHTHQKDRAALVFDLMEPIRPEADRKILEFAHATVFQPTDFTIRSNGVCRLNPEIARHVAALMEISLGPAVTVSTHFIGRNRLT